MTHHHLHIDEFSVTDIRHMLHEAWRVVSARRWYFVFPCCIFATVSFAVSLRLPRQFTSTTVIKRESDPVFANLAGKSWMQPYEDIRNRTNQRITDESFIESVLQDLDLPAGLEKFADGTLTPAAARSRKSLASSIAAGLVVRNVESSQSRDIIAIDLLSAQPDGMVDVLAAVRDRYIERARADTIGILRNVEAFLLSETDRCRSEMVKAQRRLVEYELHYPGIRPDGADPAHAEQAALIVEKVELGRRRDDLTMNKVRHNTILAAHGEGHGCDAPTTRQEPNPRYAELVAEIDRLAATMVEMRNVKAMTEAHPEVVRHRELIAVRREELAKLSPTVSVPANDPSRSADAYAAVERARQELSNTEAQLASIDGRLADVATRLASLERQRALAVEHRQEYVKQAAESERLAAELGSWQEAIAPIQNALYLENKNRSIHFATVKEAVCSAKPTSPQGMLVMMICIGAGLAAGALSVILVELFDRSYRTVKQLTTSIGIPIIESIDEIVTAASQKRRIFRNLLFLPGLAVLLMAAAIFSGTVAYVSLERPGAFESIKSSSDRLYSRMLGNG